MAPCPDQGFPQYRRIQGPPGKKTHLVSIGAQRRSGQLPSMELNPRRRQPLRSELDRQRISSMRPRTARRVGTRCRAVGGNSPPARVVLAASKHVCHRPSITTSVPCLPPASRQVYYGASGWHIHNALFTRNDAGPALQPVDAPLSDSMLPGDAPHVAVSACPITPIDRFRAPPRMPDPG